MAVLGADYVNPDFNASAKLEAGKQLRDAPFKDAMQRTNKWIASRKAARTAATQKEFDNKIQLAKAQNEINRNKHLNQVSQLKATEQTFKIESIKRDQKRQIKADTVAVASLNKVKEGYEAYSKDPSQFDRNYLRELKMLADATKGTSSEAEGLAWSANLNGALSDLNNNDLIADQNEALIAQKKGNFYTDIAKAEAANVGGYYNIKTYKTNPPTFGIDYKSPSQASVEMANGIINELELGLTTYDKLDPNDQKLVRIYSANNEDFRDRLSKVNNREADVTDEIDKEIRAANQSAVDAFVKNEIAKDFETFKSKTSIEKTKRINELKIEFEQNRPVQVTRKVGQGDFGPTDTTTIKGNAEAVAAEADIATAGLKDPFLKFKTSDGISVIDNLTPERRFEIDTKFRGDLSEIDQDISEPKVGIATGDEDQNDASEDIKDLMEQRQQIIDNAKRIGFDLSQPAPSATNNPQPAPNSDPSALTQRGEEGVNAIASQLEGLN